MAEGFAGVVGDGRLELVDQRRFVEAAAQHDVAALDVGAHVVHVRTLG